MARRDSGKRSAKGGKGPRGKRGNLQRAGTRAEKSTAKRSAVWPTERPVLFKPDRLKYVRKMLKEDGCVFCHALASGVSESSLLLYANAHSIVVMNKFPYNSGHLLVLPRRHVGDLQDLSPDENRETFALVQKCVAILKEAYQPAGFNIGVNLGAPAGAGIPEHLHVHIVPRWKGDTNFFPLIAGTKVVVETVEQTFQRLLPYFE